MRDIYSIICRLHIWTDEHGQDLIEYALTAGFIAVTAAAISPNVAASISTIYSRITSVLPVSTSPSG